MFLHSARGPAPVGDLEHWAYDTYELKWRDAGSTLSPVLVAFDVDPFGKVTSLRLSDDLLYPPGMRGWNVAEFARVAPALSYTSSRTP